MNLKNVMGVQEAAERWNVNVDTINSRIRTLAKNERKFNGMVEANLIKQSHKTWIITADLMKIWFGNEEDAKMQKLIEKWENELQHQIVDDEYEYWVYEISEQYSQNKWYGLKYVWVNKNTLENGQVYYVVNLESASELVKQNEDNWTIRDRLLNPTHDASDFTCVGVFENKDEAYKFANEGYPKINVEEVLNEMLDDEEEEE